MDKIPNMLPIDKDNQNGNIEDNNRVNTEVTDTSKKVINVQKVHIFKLADNLLSAFDNPNNTIKYQIINPRAIEIGVEKYSIPGMYLESKNVDITKKTELISTTKDRER